MLGNLEKIDFLHHIVILQLLPEVEDAKWKEEQIEKLADALEGLNRSVSAEKTAILRVVVNYAGTQFFTKEENGYFRQHESLETARDYIIHGYGADVEIETETDVRFSY